MRGLVVLLLFCSAPAISETRDISEHKVKAVYLYNFLRFVEWPAEAFKAPPPSPMNICILGENPFGQIVKSLSKHTAQQRRISVQFLKRNETSSHCHVLFISAPEQQHLKELLRGMQGSHTLIVADIPNFIQRGGMIGFVLKEGNIRFEINLDAMQTSKLIPSSKLLEVAEKIIGK